MHEDVSEKEFFYLIDGDRPTWNPQPQTHRSLNYAPFVNDHNAAIRGNLDETEGMKFLRILGSKYLY